MKKTFIKKRFLQIEKEVISKARRLANEKGVEFKSFHDKILRYSMQEMFVTAFNEFIKPIIDADRGTTKKRAGRAKKKV